MVVTSPTGSGKSTRLPIFLLEDGFAQEGMIGVVEPRRIAAVSLAEYVARRFGESSGGIVGHQIRNERMVDPRRTKIKYMTCGVLLREYALDPLLTKYKGIVLDEVHERGTEVEFLMAILRGIARIRKDFRLIVMSATINANAYARYFRAPVLHVPGRPHDIVIEYAERPVDDAIADAAEWALRAARRTERDVLIFVPDYAAIEKVLSDLESDPYARSRFSGFYPVYGNQSPTEHRAIDLRTKRNFLVSTNVGETSKTFEADGTGVDAVIDTMLVKINSFYPGTRHSELRREPHSKAGCEQRGGRTGRTRNGLLMRMCTPDEFERLEAFSVPEVLRSDLTQVTLQLLSSGMPMAKITAMPLMAKPSNATWNAAKRSLVELKAMDPTTEQLTSDGWKMAELPLPPAMARMVLASIPLNCLNEMAVIAASFVAHEVFRRPPRMRKEADEAHERFADARSDYVALYRAWRAWHAIEESKREAFADENYLHHGALVDITKTAERLLEILAAHGIVPVDHGFMPDRIGIAVATGLSATNLLTYHKAKDDKDSCYLTPNRQRVEIFPGSFLADEAPAKYIVAAEIVTTTRCFARSIQVVQETWLDRLPRPTVQAEVHKDSRKQRRKKAKKSRNDHLQYRR